MDDLFRDIFERAPDALLVVDRGGRVVQANGRAALLFGYPEGELAGLAIAALLPELTADMAEDEALTGRTKTGSPISVGLVRSPIESGAGGLVLYTLRTSYSSASVWPLFATLVEAATDAIIGIDLRGTIRSWNSAAARIFGYQADEIIGASINQLLTPEQADDEDLLVHLRQGREVTVYEATRRCKDGVLLPVWVRITPIRGPDGALLGASKVMRDISNLKQAAAILRESEERFRNAFNSAAIGMALVGLDGRWLRVNAALCAIVGYSEEELLQRTFQDLTYPADLDANLGLVRQTLAGAISSYHMEKRYFHKAGHVVWVLLAVSLVRDDRGEPLYFVSQLQNISDRKAAEERLAETSRSREETLALLNTLIASAPAGLAFVDRDYRFLRCNEALAELNGIPAADHTGRLVAEVVPDLWPQLRPIYDQVLAGRGPIVNHAIAGATAAAPGKPRHWLGSYYPVRLGNEIIGIGVMITEVTAQKRLEEQLRQSQKMQAIGQLASGVAHDFNNLLTVINGYSDMLQLDLSDMVGPEHPINEAVNSIRDAGERAALLTRQLLQLSRKTEPELVTLSVGEVIARIVRMLERLLGEQITLITLGLGHVRQVRADRSQIEQVLLNLALNARDAMPEGGQLIIEVNDFDLDGEMGYNGPGHRPGPYVQLTVSDTGVGMSPQVQERIFEPFFTTKEAGKGTGLGLATVYGIVEQSGGFITVYSEPGLGTTFNVYFPAINVSASVAPAEREPTYRLSGSECIMLVEDEDGVLRIARIALETQGYQVIAAQGGAEALQLAAAHPAAIDLLITDVVMPGMSGRQIADALRASQPTIKILFTSGYAGEAISRHGILDAGDGFLQKPFTPFTLARSVREVLDR